MIRDRAVGQAVLERCRPDTGGAPVLMLSLDGDTPAVRRGLTLAKDWLDTGRVDGEWRDRVMIVLAEVLNNVVEHAFARRAAGRIDMTVRAGPRDVTLDIADNGAPMPGNAPPAYRCPGVEAPRDALPEGGFGWNLIHDLARDVDYRRTENVNRLRLRIPVSTAA